MKIALLILSVFVISTILLFFIDHKLNGNKNKKLHNNLKKMNDADTNRI